MILDYNFDDENFEYEVDEVKAVKNVLLNNVKYEFKNKNQRNMTPDEVEIAKLSLETVVDIDCVERIADYIIDDIKEFYQDLALKEYFYQQNSYTSEQAYNDEVLSPQSRYW